MSAEAEAWYEEGRRALARSFTADTRSDCRADLEEGLAALDRALAIDAAHLPAIVDRALALAWLERWGDAADALGAAVALAPARADLRLAAARAAQRAGRVGEAARAYAELLRAQPFDAHARWWLAESLEALGEKTQADGVWAALGEVDPKESSAQIARGLERVAPSPPSPLSRLLRVGRRLDEEGHPAEAMEMFRAALHLTPQPLPMFHPMRGAVETVASAREVFLGSMRSCWDQRWARRQTAELWYRWGEVDEAVAACRAWSELEPGSAAPHGLMAEALVRGGRLDEARACWQEAVDLDPRHLGYRARAAVYGWRLEPRGREGGASAGER